MKKAWTIINSLLIIVVLTLVIVIFKDYYKHDCYRTSFKGYIKTSSDIFKEEKDKSPLPVLMYNEHKYIEEYGKRNYFLKSTIIEGAYISNNTKNKNRPKEYIFINNTLTAKESIITLFHEFGHYNCKKSKCECFDKSDEKHNTMKEYHAYWYSLKLCLEKKLPDILIICMEQIKTTKALTKHPDSDKDYTVAAGQTIRTMMWNSCKKYLKNVEREKE